MGKLEEFKELFGVTKPIIGVVHIRALPGSPSYGNERLDDILKSVLDDVKKLKEGGVDGIIIENSGDGAWPSSGLESVLSMGVIAWEVRKKYTKIPLGIAMIGDPISAIAIAYSSKAEFVRVNVLTEAIVGIYGVLEGKPYEIMKYRRIVDPNIKIFADVQIKHGVPLSKRPIADSAYDTSHLAESVIISGQFTGTEVSMEELVSVKDKLKDYPVIIGSGANPDNIKKLLDYADAAIVGTYFKTMNNTQIDFEKIVRMVEIVKSIRKKD